MTSWYICDKQIPMVFDTNAPLRQFVLRGVGYILKSRTYWLRVLKTASLLNKFVCLRRWNLIIIVVSACANGISCIKNWLFLWNTQQFNYLGVRACSPQCIRVYYIIIIACIVAPYKPHTLGFLSACWLYVDFPRSQSSKIMATLRASSL